MRDLSGGSERVRLGSGYAITAPGLRGEVELIRGGGDDTRAREQSTPLLDGVLQRVEMSGVATVEVDARPVPGAQAAAPLRDAHGDDALLLEVPDLGPEVGQVVLSVDEAGALSWHFPLEGEQGAATRSGSAKRFLIRRYVPAQPPSDAGQDRALFGAIGRKLLKVIVYPITDALIGKPAAAIAERWEAKNRAYGVRNFSPGNYRQPTAANGAQNRWGLTAADVDRLAEGPALLFIHGTFSTAHSAFGDLPLDLMQDLHARYDGRVFAFNHFTLSHDPERNAQWLAGRIRELSADVQIEADVICHSRGGLVARVLDGAGQAFDVDPGRVRVRRVAFVGVPNQGTLLAQPSHMVDMIDRLTTGLNLVPASGVADVLEGILIAVKIIGHGALKGLAGLQAMNPNGPFLKRFKQAARHNAEYYAVAANYEPTDPGLRGLVSRGKDLVADHVFGGAGNDLVVPEAGVYAADDFDGFPIPTERLLRLPSSAGVMHTDMFGHPDVVQRLRAWLQ